MMKCRTVLNRNGFRLGLIVVALVVLLGFACTPVTAQADSIGDPGIASEEVSCAEALPIAPWDQTLVPGFNFNSERTSCFPCAQFPGSMTGPNEVKALLTSPGYVTPFTTTTCGPNDVYWYAGCTGDANPPQWQTYIVKVEPVTMKQIWRTNLSSSQNNSLHACGAHWTWADGNLLAVSDHTLYKLNGTTGAIIMQTDLPTGDNPPGDSAFNGFDAFPDGTLIVKSLNRPVGCTLNGLSSVFACPGGVTAANPSVLSAIDPTTFKVLYSLELAGNFPSRVTTSRFQGHDYIYLVNLNGQLLRWEWDGKVIKQDTSFGAVNYIKPGQTGGGAPTVMGDWVILNTNGLAVPASMSIVAISQANPSQIASINLTQTMQPGQVSTSAAKPTVDPDNQRIFMCDYGVGTCSAIALRDGKLSMLWQSEQRTNSFTTLIGPKDNRVFIATNIKSNVTNISQLAPGPSGANYTEQYQWRDASTGKLLAESAFYSPSAPGSQIPPGYGGITYGLIYNGDVVAMYPSEAPATTTTQTPTPTSAAGGVGMIITALAAAGVVFAVRKGRGL